MRLTRSIAAVAIGAVAAAAAVAAPVTLQFESFADLAPIERLGWVQLEGAVALEAGQSLNEFEAPPRSGVGVAAASGTVLTLLFDAGTDVDAVGAYATYRAPLIVRYFTIGNQLLGTSMSLYGSNFAFSGEAGSQPNEYLEFLSPNIPITRVDFVANAPQAFVLDDITLFTADGPIDVPEPGTMVLLLAGVLALPLRRRRARCAAAGLLAASSAMAQNAVGDLEVFPQVVPVGSATTVTARISLASPRVIPAGVLLNEIAPDGRIAARLGQFRDDGTNGDQTAGDRVYTARFQVQNAQPRDLRIAASIAYAGSLTRVASSSVLVSVAADANPAAGFASAADGRLHFRSASGGLMSSIPLAIATEAVVNPSSPRRILKTNEIPLLCQAQSRAGILTWRVQLEEPLMEEGVELPSVFRYFSASGVELFAATSTPGTIFFADSESGNISRSCARILLGEVAVDGSSLRAILLSDAGTALSQFDLSAQISELQELKITPDGRYGAVRGLAGSGPAQQTVLMVIDLDTDARFVRQFPKADGYAFLVENGTGSFAVVVDDAFRENLP